MKSVKLWLPHLVFKHSSYNVFTIHPKGISIFRSLVFSFSVVGLTFVNAQSYETLYKTFSFLLEELEHHKNLDIELQSIFPLGEKKKKSLAFPFKATLLLFSLCCTLHWCGLVSSIMYSFGHRDIRRL